jgi:tetratricopeptide (TPR) repeat protein
MLAYAASMTERKTEEKKAEASVSIGLLMGTGFIMFLLIFATDINVARANRATLGTLRSLYTLQDPVGSYQTTIAIPSPHIDDIRNDFARTVQGIVPEYHKNGQGELAKQLLGLAFDELNKNRALHPLDIRAHLQQAQLAEIGGALFQNGEMVFQAEAALEDALSKSPKRQQVQFTLAANKIQLGKFDEAIVIMKQAVENDPKISESWWRLALVYQEAGRTEEAQTVVREARERGLVFDARGEQITNAILPLEGVTGTATGSP